VVADDKRVEKKDRTVNEPLQFYCREIALSDCCTVGGKDQISGYLPDPEVPEPLTVSRRRYASKFRSEAATARERRYCAYRFFT